MYKTASVKWKPLVVSLAISLGTGLLASLLTGSAMDVYSSLGKPPLAPPGVVFPIVWTVLYAVMGISAYMVYIEKEKNRRGALTVYSVQLALNFWWSIIFFNLENPEAAFICIVLLWAAIVTMIVLFYKINRTAGLLQIPYLLWVSFATYLNAWYAFS